MLFQRASRRRSDVANAGLCGEVGRVLDALAGRIGRGTAAAISAEAKAGLKRLAQEPPAESK